MKKYIYTLLALISFLYYLWLGFHNSFRMSVLPFWIILSALFLLLGHRHRLTLCHKIPAFMKRVLKICFCACLIFFLFVESCIVWGISRDTGENLDYILMLGAGLNGDKPSAVLEIRPSRLFPSAPASSLHGSGILHHMRGCPAGKSGLIRHLLVTVHPAMSFS